MENNGHRPLLSRADILAAGKAKTKTITGWGGQLLIRQISGAQSLEIDNKYDKDTRLAAWVRFSVIDEDGNLMFDDADIEALMETAAGELVRVGKEILAFNGIGEDADQGITKNSEAPPTASASV